MTSYEELKRASYVIKLDLTQCSKNHPMSPTTRIELPKKTTVLWVAWGDRHAREALANARWFWEIHREWYGNLVVEVRLLGDVALPSSMIQRCRDVGINVLIDLPPPPNNQALYDVDRLGHATSIDGSVLYIDTDLYALKPLPLEKLIGRKFLTFGMGPAMMGRAVAQTHKIVDEMIGAPSYLYWHDIGLSLNDYDAKCFWPWLRINMGMFWIDEAKDALTFYEDFKAINEELCFTKHFGVGEMIFTAMHAAGKIPNHELDWRNGWNKIWPWIGNHDQQIGVSIKGSMATCIFPLEHHDVIHMSHLGVQLHSHMDPMWRKVHMWMEDDGSVMLHFGMTPKTNESGGFDVI